MTLILIALAASALAATTYLLLERAGRKAWPAMVCRAVAWTALGVLLANLTCAAPAGSLSRPLVLFDGSLSLGAAGGRWREALDTARALGEVRWFGDENGAPDTLPSAGRSLLAPALAAGAASDRQVIVVTDGELQDAADLAPEALRRVGVRLFRREIQNDLAISRVTGPIRAAAGDSVTLELELRAIGDSARDTVTVELRADQRLLGRRNVRLSRDGIAATRMTFATAGWAGGDYLLEARLVNSRDAEPRDDARSWLLKVTPTPGVVFLASPVDWDARFLYRAIRDVAQLPVRGYLRLEPTRWRNMETLAPVASEDVAHAARLADLLIVKGEAPDFTRQSKARGIWFWPSGEGGETVLDADWYVVGGGVSPLAPALVGLPVDSFPPLNRITPIEAGPGDWVGLTAQDGRRGAERPVIVGRQTAGGRRLQTAADGFWRWAFRGASSEQGYRSLVAASVSWLLGTPDSAAGRARPVRSVVQNGRPVTFEWSGGGAVAPIPIAVTGSGVERADTLRFNGSGRADIRLPVGRYRYRLAGGGEGTIAVEQYSDEWLPGPVVLDERPVPAVAQTRTTNSRSWIWLFGLCIAGLGGEWWTRRRLGLR